MTHLENVLKDMVNQVRNGETQLLSVLLEGKTGCGKTALAAYTALKSSFSYCKLISPE